MCAYPITPAPVACPISPTAQVPIAVTVTITTQQLPQQLSSSSVSFVVSLSCVPPVSTSSPSSYPQISLPRQANPRPTPNPIKHPALPSCTTSAAACPPTPTSVILALASTVTARAHMCPWMDVICSGSPSRIWRREMYIRCYQGIRTPLRVVARARRGGRSVRARDLRHGGDAGDRSGGTRPRGSRRRRVVVCDCVGVYISCLENIVSECIL